MIKSENFSFKFTKDVNEFMILKRDVKEIRSKLCKVYETCLNIQEAKIDLKFVRAWKFWYMEKSHSTNNTDIRSLRSKYKGLR